MGQTCFLSVKIGVLGGYKWGKMQCFRIFEGVKNIKIVVFMRLAGFLLKTSVHISLVLGWGL